MFNEFRVACITNGRKLVTKRGSEAAVLVAVDVSMCLQAAARPRLKELLLTD
jgi:antitoxin Phd